MNSLDPLINSMHDSYCCAMGIELEMTMAHERWWLAAIAEGLTPDDIRTVVEQRLKFNRGNTCKKGLMIHHLVRGEEEISICLNEVAVFKASQRIKVMNPAKASVLRATGRPDTLPDTPAQAVANSELLNALRKAAS